MRKVPTIFIRDWDGDKSLVTEMINPECQWVFDGEGTATRKFDGACVRILNGELWVRYDAKQGKTPPPGFEPAQEKPDPDTGHWPGWLRPDFSNPQYRWHIRAFENSKSSAMLDGDGTYEACGPHFQGNPEAYAADFLVKHGDRLIIKLDEPVTLEGLKLLLHDMDVEGIVWHHPDGRMAKIKKRDLGLKRKPE